MIDIDAAATSYFQKLIAQQGIKDLSIRLRALHAGTAKGDCRLEFCEPSEVESDDWRIDCEGFSLIVDSASEPFLRELSISYQPDRTGGQLTIRAPQLKGKPPEAGAGVIERVQYVLASEINPGVAAHGGKVSLVEVTSEGVVVLQFGGGCHGCGQVDVTLKQGIEKTLMQRVPEISAVRDATDHSTGHAPYFKR